MIIHYSSTAAVDFPSTGDLSKGGPTSQHQGTLTFSTIIPSLTFSLSLGPRFYTKANSMVSS